MPKVSRVNKQIKFKSIMENIAVGKEYYALAIPAKVTKILGTVGPVPVLAKVNGSEAFLASLYPVGGGRHYLRVRNKICKSVGVEARDPVRVEITVRDRLAEIAIPKDVMAVLKAKKMQKAFKALPIGKKSYLLRLIERAVKPETRLKKIQAAVHEAKLFSLK